MNLRIFQMVSVTPGGRYLAVPYTDGVIDVYDTQSDQQVRNFSADKVTCSAINFRLLVCGRADGSVSFWQLSDNSAVPTWSVDIRSVPSRIHITEEGHIVVGTKDGRVIIFDGSTMAYMDFHKHNSEIRCIVSHGRSLVTTSMMSTYVHNMDTGVIDMYSGGFWCAFDGTQVAVAELDVVHLYAPKRPPREINTKLGAIRGLAFNSQELVILCANGVTFYSEPSMSASEYVGGAITDAVFDPLSRTFFFFDAEDNFDSVRIE